MTDDYTYQEWKIDILCTYAAKIDDICKAPYRNLHLKHNTNFLPYTQRVSICANLRHSLNMPVASYYSF